MIQLWLDSCSLMWNHLHRLFVRPNPRFDQRPEVTDRLTCEMSAEPCANRAIDNREMSFGHQQASLPRLRQSTLLLNRFIVSAPFVPYRAIDTLLERRVLLASVL